MCGHCNLVCGLVLTLFWLCAGITLFFVASSVTWPAGISRIDAWMNGSLHESDSSLGSKDMSGLSLWVCECIPSLGSPSTSHIKIYESIVSITWNTQWAASFTQQQRSRHTSPCQSIITKSVVKKLLCYPSSIIDSKKQTCQFPHRKPIK